MSSIWVVHGPGEVARVPSAGHFVLFYEFSSACSGSLRHYAGHLSSLMSFLQSVVIPSATMRGICPLLGGFSICPLSGGFVNLSSLSRLVLSQEGSSICPLLGGFFNLSSLRRSFCGVLFPQVSSQVICRSYESPTSIQATNEHGPPMVWVYPAHDPLLVHPQYFHWPLSLWPKIYNWLLSATIDTMAII